jgi:hypothetical protein
LCEAAQRSAERERERVQEEGRRETHQEEHLYSLGRIREHGDELGRLVHRTLLDAHLREWLRHHRTHNRHAIKKNVSSVLAAAVVELAVVVVKGVDRRQGRRTRNPMGDFLDFANCSRVAQSRAVDRARTATHQKRLSGTW